MLIRLLIYYLLAVNLLAFVAFGVDKRKARHRQWRISEAALLWLAVAGGSVGALVAMRVFHHKTLHRKFRIGVPLILLAQIMLAIAAFIWLA